MAKSLVIPPEFDCEPDTIVGPVTKARIRREEQRWADLEPPHRFDPLYVEYTVRNHGGVPKRPWFRTHSGTVRRLGRFINFGGPYTPPLQDDWEGRGRELRGKWSHGSLGSIANISGGCGAYLIPLGIPYFGPHRPEEMGTTHSDLVCFDYSDPSRRLPAIVLWTNHLATREYYNCEDRGEDPFTDMNLSRFTEPIAENFAEFLLGMRPSESDF